MQWANNRIGVPGSIRPIIILVLDLRSIRVAGSLPPVLRSALYAQWRWTLLACANNPRNGMRIADFAMSTEADR